MLAFFILNQMSFLEINCRSVNIFDGKNATCLLKESARTLSNFNLRLDVYLGGTQVVKTFDDSYILPQDSSHSSI